MAEAYFDNKLKDASVKAQRKSRTIEAFNRLPEEFTIDDVVRCFDVSVESARVRLSRLMKDRLIIKLDDFKENGQYKAKYKKTSVVML